MRMQRLSNRICMNMCDESLKTARIDELQQQKKHSSIFDARGRTDLSL